MTTEPGLSIVEMNQRKRIALIAHDNCKAELLDWARFNRGTLAAHELYATGTTGAIIAGERRLNVVRFLSGPLGGDLQVGAAIVEGRLDYVDVKALLRIAIVYNIPIGCNRSTADFLLSSPLMENRYPRRLNAEIARRSQPPHDSATYQVL